MQRKFRLLREAAYEDGRATFRALAVQPYFRDFVALYMAEGYKRCRNAVSLANSDPAIVRMATEWIRFFTENRVSYSIQYHADQDIDELRRFWGEELEVEPSAIRTQRKSNSNQLTGRRWRSRYGVLTVSVGDTYLRARLQAWMECVQEDWLHSKPSGCSAAW